MEKEGITQLRFASTDQWKGDGTEMLVKGNMTWYAELKNQFKAVADTALYINQSFHQIKEEFLSVIDHLETEEDEGEARERQIHNDRIREELKISYSRLSPESLQTLNKNNRKSQGGLPLNKRNFEENKKIWNNVMGPWLGSVLQF